MINMYWLLQVLHCRFMMSVTSMLSYSDGKQNTQIFMKKSEFSLIEVEILARIKAADVSPEN